MGRASTALLGLFLFAACSKHADSLSPPELLERCTPGEPNWDCYYGLKNSPPRMFPADRLEGMDISLQLVPQTREGFVPGMPANKAVLVYVMKLNVGRDFVMRLLETELGEPLGRGTPRVPTTTSYVGDYWQTDEGHWICFDHGVAWYSEPFQSGDGQTMPAIPVRDPDPYARKLPKTAALWRKVGLLLIGSDTKPRPRDVPTSSAY